MPSVSGTEGDFSRVFLDVTTGDAIGSVSADGKTVSKFHYNVSKKLEIVREEARGGGMLVSKFHYNVSKKLDYIDQYAQGAALSVLATTAMPSVSGAEGDFSRVFLDVTTGDAIGSVSADGKTVSKFHYNVSKKL